MSKFENCITHAPNSFFFRVRESYIHLCKDAPQPLCAAVLLDTMERWTVSRLNAYADSLRKRQAAKEKGRTPPPIQTLWVYMPVAGWQQEIYGLFGETAVRKNLKWLVDNGYISQRTNRRNKWDRTLQYLFQVNKVQAALDESIGAPFRKFTLSIAQIYGIDSVTVPNRRRKNTEAIQQTPKQTQEQKDSAPDGAAPQKAKKKKPAARKKLYDDIPHATRTAIIHAWWSSLKTQPIVDKEPYGWDSAHETAAMISRAGYTAEKVKEFVEAMMEPGQWWASRSSSLTLQMVARDLPAWVAEDKPTNPLGKHTKVLNAS